jgi:cell division protein ZapA (FtsZ GTPase activity inhibitor)
MNEKKTYSVTIFNDTYTLKSDESHEHVMRAAQTVDAIMQGIAARVDLAPMRIAVLAALRLASRLQEHETSVLAQQDALGSCIDEAIAALSSRTTSSSDRA